MREKCRRTIDSISALKRPPYFFAKPFICIVLRRSEVCTSAVHAHLRDKPVPISNISARCPQNHSFPARVFPLRTSDDSPSAQTNHLADAPRARAKKFVFKNALVKMREKPLQVSPPPRERRSLPLHTFDVRADGVLDNPSVEKMNRAIGDARVARIVRNHADGSAFTMQLPQQLHHRFAVLRI